MGWLWSSAATDENKSPPPSDDPIAPEPPTVTTNPPPGSTEPQTRDEAANSELVVFLKSLQRTPPSDAHTDPHRHTPPDGTVDIDDLDNEDDEDDNVDPPPLMTPAHLYPSTASCRQLFDGAFYCQSPGGQFMNIYRYGQLKDCRQHWKDFWWCMRTNRAWMEKEEREDRCRRRGWERDMRVRRRPEGCSEDIWRQRKRVIGGGVFVTGEIPEYRPENEENKRVGGTP
ncbi:MAG: hypothetical protein Q9163_001275 [Psora crenata]